MHSLAVPANLMKRPQCLSALRDDGRTRPGASGPAISFFTAIQRWPHWLSCMPSRITPAPPQSKEPMSMKLTYSDVLILLLNKELRPAVEKEYLTAKQSRVRPIVSSIRTRQDCIEGTCRARCFIHHDPTLFLLLAVFAAGRN